MKKVTVTSSQTSISWHFFVRSGHACGLDVPQCIASPFKPGPCNRFISISIPDSFFPSLKSLLGIAIFFAVSMPLCGQSLGRQLIGSAGGSGRFGDVQLSWSFGEVAVGHLKAANGTGRMTEGFQQPSLMPLIEGADPTLVQVAPNPVRDILNIYIPGDSREEWAVTLADVKGRILLRSTGLSAGNSAIDLSHLSAGTYFLSISEAATGHNLQTLRVVKVQ